MGRLAQKPARRIRIRVVVKERTRGEHRPFVGRPEPADLNLHSTNVARGPGLGVDTAARFAPRGEVPIVELHRSGQRQPRRRSIGGWPSPRARPPVSSRWMSCSLRRAITRCRSRRFATRSPRSGPPLPARPLRHPGRRPGDLAARDRRKRRATALALARRARSRPADTRPVTIECAGNGRARLEPRPLSQPWLTEAVGTAEWTGVPLSAVLEEAGLRDDVGGRSCSRGSTGGSRAAPSSSSRAACPGPRLSGRTLCSPMR